MLTLGAPVLIGTAHEELLTLRNFHPPEDGFAWSSRRWCEVIFACELDDAEGMDEVLLAFDVNAFQRASLAPGVDIIVYLNGTRVGGAVVERRQMVEFFIPTSLFAINENILALDVPDAAIPAEYGGDDTRLLGLQLFSVGIFGNAPAMTKDQRPRRDTVSSRAAPAGSTKTVRRVDRY